MKKTIGIVAAVAFHAALLMFGGLLFMRNTDVPSPPKTVEVVDLTATEEKKETKEEKAPDRPEDETPAEESDEAVLEKPDDAPDLQQLAALDAPAAPALDALSLSALEDALAGSGEAAGDAGFSTGVDLASGGRIGGTGKPGAGPSLDLDTAFTLAELDQKPRAIVQPPPVYPYELRQRKVEGSVRLLFVVDASGRVVDPRVETASRPEFEKAALDAVRQWRFEPAVRNGQKVSCRMRIPLRFSAA